MVVTRVTLERVDGQCVPLGVGLQESAEHPEHFRRIRVKEYVLPPDLVQNPYLDPGSEPIVRDRP